MISEILGTPFIVVSGLVTATWFIAKAILAPYRMAHERYMFDARERATRQILQAEEVKISEQKSTQPVYTLKVDDRRRCPHCSDLNIDLNPSSGTPFCAKCKRFSQRSFL